MASRKGFGAPGDGVLIEVVGDSLLGGLLDDLGRAKIRKPLARLMAFRFHGQPRHLADDGLGKFGGSLATNLGLWLESATGRTKLF